MTSDALPGKARRSTRRKTEPETLAIGEVDANIVACPACARPLDSGASRCPGCGTRMIGGIRATKALGFAASGLVVGLIVGTGVTGLVAIASRPAVGPAVVETPVASVAPLTSAAPLPSTAPVVDPTIPTAAVSAIRQAALLNQRLADDAGRLAALLATSSPSSADLARVLRTLNANAAVGERIAPQVATWTDASALSASLATLYLEVGGTAREALASSLNNTAAYVDGSERMVDILARLAALDAEARPLADQANLELAPLVLP
jgi:hypothetical protein